jgi:predicted permease
MRKLLNLLRRNRVRMEQDLDRELCYHLDRRVQDLMREGLSESEAHRKAVIEFGGVAQVQEEVRDTWVWICLRDLAGDIRYAVRMLRKSPGFTAVAVLSLALGIGANSTIFSAINALLLRPLPYPHEDRLVAIQNKGLKQGARPFRASTADLLNWRAHSQVFEQLEATSNPDMTALSGAGEPERVGMVAVTGGFFPLVGATTVLGRLPTDEDIRGRPLVLSYEFWQRHFARDPKVLGQSLFVDNGLWTVVGVFSPRFDFFGQGKGDVYRLLPTNVAQLSNQRWLWGVGRLKTGVTIEQAQASMDIVARRLEETSPKTNKGLGLKIEPLQEALFGSLRSLLYPLLATVGFVLLIACANIANLLLSRAATRRKEVGVRAALGAGRFRLIRQMLTEGVLLSLMGGMLGLLISAGGIKSFIALAPRWFPQANSITIDARVLAYTFALSILAGIAFALAPALRLSRVDLNDSLKEGGRASGRGSRQRTRNALVVAEIGLALVLLVCAGLMINTFVRVLRTDPGFKPEQLLTMEVRLLGKKYFDNSGYRNTGYALVTPQVGMFSSQLLERMKVLPGVEAAALVDWFPMIENRANSGAQITISGDSALHPGERAGAMYSVISADYFQVMQIPLLRGRRFTEQDQESSPWVVIINEAMARKFWPNSDPIGQVIKMETAPGEQPPREIVGIVGNVRQFQLGAQPAPEMYIHYTQQSPRCTAGDTESRLHRSLVVRSRSEPKSVIDSLRGAIRELDKDAPIFGIKSVPQTVSDSAVVPRFIAQLLGGFSALALLLAAIGIYGVISYSVNERSHEIGLRLALGAQTGEVIKLILKQGFILALAGTAVGLAGALAATPVIGSFLYDVKPHDPLTITLVTLFLVGITMLATYIPARRATKVDPIVTLRHE